MRAAAPTPVLPFDVRLLNATAAALFSVAGVLAALWLTAWLMRQPMFNIRQVQIEGDVARNSVATIRANALPRLAGNFFSVDLERAQRAFQAVPWVRTAIVRRVWPNRLSVQLQEHRAAALWSVPEGDDQLVNTQGEVFQANLGDVEDEALPVLQGPQGSASEVLAAYRRLQPMYARLGLPLNALRLSGRGSWRADFEGGAQVELGRGTVDELAARSERFVATVPQVIERYQRPLVHADLRHDEGYAVRLKGITTTLAVPAGTRK